MVNKGKRKEKIKRIYWDTAAGTPVDRRVLKKMMPHLGGGFGAPHEASAKWGNSSSIHQEGVEASKAVEEARAKIAEILQAHPDEIIFTGSGTESDNLAILGIAELHPTTKDVRSTTSGSLEVGLLTSGQVGFRSSGRIITTAIEHKAVLEPCRYLQKRGTRATYLKVDSNGQINLKEFKESLTKDTFLVSIMLANNEIGSIEPIKEVVKIIRHWRKDNKTHLPYLHTDVCQAPRFIDLNVAQLGVDLMSFNGSKIYGPKGVGALYVRRGVMLAPIIMGGGQERGLRSGTLNVAGIVGLAEALAICDKERNQEVKKLMPLQIKLMGELEKIPEVKINGLAVRSPTSGSLEVGLRTAGRLPNNINFSVAGFDGEQLVLELDAKGFAVSSGSACSHDSGEGSYAIRAIGGDEARALGAVRVSLGREATMAEINYFVKSLKEIIKKYDGLVDKSLA